METAGQTADSTKHRAGVPSPPIDRRQFLQRAIAAGAGTAVLPATMVSAQTAKPGASPYGELTTEPDENGLLLPEGFTSRILAVGGEPVADTGYAWHAFPDGAATFPADDGGWILAVNSEVTALFAPDQGGVSAIRFDADGEVVDAYRILEGSTSNCAGGPTPWGTWLSCEEPLDKKGRLWECDPTGKEEPVAHEAMGLWNREAAAVDPKGEAVYMTEDDGSGLLYRYTPTAYPDLSEGLLEAAIVDDDGGVTWGEIPDPSAATAPTNQQLADATRFNGGEGIWFHDETIFFTTKGDNRVHAIDLEEQQYRLIWESDPDEDGVEGAVLSGVDNITVDDATGDLFVAEDGGDMEVCIITPEGAVAPFARVAENPNGSEITGPCLSPDRTRLYFSSQRGTSPKGLDEIIPGTDKDAKIAGITYEVTGPFRKPTAEPESPTTTLAKANPSAGTGSDGGSEDEGGSTSAPVVIGGIAVLAAAGIGATVALRRRRDPDAAPAAADDATPDDGA
ncbi:alkaline phosphatase PhoX [Aquihabitans daechungensis]|uniref:alkaline phosphatase PhoX n=1 Tax=Aquihabitans daechungensis TaxID=1052257 RepID=UPI003BA02E01